MNKLPERISFDESLDEQISKVERLINLYTQAKELEKDSMIMTPEDVAEELKISEPLAREFMSQDGFPLLRCGEKKLRVNRLAFLTYTTERRA